MKYDDNLEKTVTAVLGVVGTLAILVSLGLKGTTAENVLDAVKDISGLVISIAVFLIASAISRKSRSILDVGVQALQKLQAKNAAVLIGPAYDKAKYLPDDSEAKTRMQYLFLKPVKGKKIAFIPLDPLAQGILDIRISKGSLVALGLAAETAAGRLSECQEQVRAAVMKVIASEAKHFTLVHPTNGAPTAHDGADGNDEDTAEKDSAKGAKTRYANSAIIVDFDEVAIGPRRFERMIVASGLAALQVLTGFRS